jgi:hypothetical protein
MCGSNSEKKVSSESDRPDAGRFFYAPDACKNSGKEMHASMKTADKSKHLPPPLTEISSTYRGAHRYLPGFIGLKGGDRNV